MTTETLPAETYPWDSPEPVVHPPSVSLIVVPATPIETFDHKGSGTSMVSGLRLGDVTLHMGLYSDDEALAQIDRLTEALRELRDGIDRRLTIAAHGPLPTADDVRGILA